MPALTSVDITLLVIALLALTVAVVATVKIVLLGRDVLLVRGGSSEQSLAAATAAQIRAVEILRGEVADAKQALAIAQRDLNAAFRHVAVVRFDAFPDMGGRLSFAAAILDDNGDGVLLTSIHGHTESRMYIKTVTRRKADGRASAEELEAIATASPIGG